MANRTSVEHLLAAANASAAHARTIWVTFLLFGSYLLITVGATSHLDLLLENSAPLPLLNVDLDLVTFFWVAPLLFLVYYLYTLIAHLILAGRYHALSTALAAEHRTNEDLELFRQRTHPDLAAQRLAGPGYGRVPTFAIDLIMWLTLVAWPIVVLLAFQIRFLPYHHELVTWGHRVFVLTAVAFVWVFWPLIRQPQVPSRPSFHKIHHARMARAVVSAAASALVLFFSIGVATVPEERIEGWLASTGISDYVRGRPVFWPTAVLFDGDVDHVRQAPASWLSRNLVVVDTDLVAQRPELQLRGRDLRYGVFTGSRFPGADLFAVQLMGADLAAADLEGATLDAADLRLANLTFANLSRATLSGSQLTRARLAFARLQGARLDGADLERALLRQAQLQGAWLDGARLQNANLSDAQLQGARLEFAVLRNATLSGAGLQAATLAGAELRGATLDDSDLRGATLAGASLNWASLNGAQLQGATVRHAYVWGATMTDASTDLFDARDVNVEPRFRRDRGEADWSEQRTWRELASGASADRYGERIVAYLAELACATAHAPWVATGIARRVVHPRAAWHVGPEMFGRVVLQRGRARQVPLFRIESAPPIGDDRPVRRGVALRLLDFNCAGAAELDEHLRAALLDLAAEKDGR